MTRSLILTVLGSNEDMALMNLSILGVKPWLYDPPLQPEILDAHEEVWHDFHTYILDFQTFILIGGADS